MLLLRIELDGHKQDIAFIFCICLQITLFFNYEGDNIKLNLADRLATLRQDSIVLDWQMRIISCHLSDSFIKEFSSYPKYLTLIKVWRVGNYEIRLNLGFPMISLQCQLAEVSLIDFNTPDCTWWPQTSTGCIHIWCLILNHFVFRVWRPLHKVNLADILATLWQDSFVLDWEITTISCHLFDNFIHKFFWYPNYLIFIKFWWDGNNKRLLNISNTILSHIITYVLQVWTRYYKV